MNEPINVVRLNVTLPEELVTKIRKRVKGRGMSRYLSDAAREKMEREEREKALETLLSAPATFSNISDSRSYIANSRDLDERRDERLKG